MNTDYFAFMLGFFEKVTSGKCVNDPDNWEYKANKAVVPYYTDVDEWRKQAVNIYPQI